MPARVIDSYLRTLDGVAPRRVSESEWGLALEAAGWPLAVGLRINRGLPRAQAPLEVSEPLDATLLLHRNRSLELVRFATTAAGEPWVLGDLPADDLTAASLDRLLGALVEAASSLRQAAADGQAARRRARSR